MKESRTILVQKLSPPCQRYLDEFTEQKSLFRDKYLWKMGDRASVLAQVVEGAIEIARVSDSGEEVVLSIFGPRGFIGASAVVGQMPYPASARATADRTVVRVIHIAAALSRSTQALREEIGGWLNSLLVAHEEILRERLSIQSCGQLPQRLFGLLRHLNDHYGHTTPSGGSRLPFALAKNQIARLLGSRPETIIRICSKLRREGLVAFEARFVEIPSWERFEEAVRPE